MRMEQSPVSSGKGEWRIWMDYAECKKGIQKNTISNCIYLDEFEMVGKELGIEG